MFENASSLRSCHFSHIFHERNQSSRPLSHTLGPNRIVTTQPFPNRILFFQLRPTSKFERRSCMEWPFLYNSAVHVNPLLVAESILRTTSLADRLLIRKPDVHQTHSCTHTYTLSLLKYHLSSHLHIHTPYMRFMVISIWRALTVPRYET